MKESSVVANTFSFVDI